MLATGQRKESAREAGGGAVQRISDERILQTLRTLGKATTARISQACGGKQHESAVRDRLRQLEERFVVYKHGEKYAIL